MSSPSRTRRRQQLRERAACPDCGSDVRIVSEAPGVAQVRVAHDTTCPWFARTNASRPFRQIRITAGGGA